MCCRRSDVKVPGTMRKGARTIELQPWAFSERPRVLIEHRDPDSGLELAAAIRRAGCTVGICRGPDATADPPTRCPLHGLEPCVAVEGADLVVTALDLDGEEAREVLDGLRTRYPSTPLTVLATVDQAIELGGLLEGCTVLPVAATPEQVAAEVLNILQRD
jgi:hypothetical protein